MIHTVHLLTTESSSLGATRGKIVDEIGPYVMIAYDAMAGGQFVMPMELIRLEDMGERCEHGHARFSFFNSREDLQSWLDWLNAPPKPSIVNLVTSN